MLGVMKLHNEDITVINLYAQNTIMSKNIFKIITKRNKLM